MGREPQLSYLKVLLLGQLTLEAMDELNGTSKYKHNLKLNGKRFLKQLEGYLRNDYDIVYSNDAEIATNVLNKLESLIDKLRTSDVDELVMIDAVIDKYHDNKEWFKEHADAEFLKNNYDIYKKYNKDLEKMFNTLLSSTTSTTSIADLIREVKDLNQKELNDLMKYVQTKKYQKSYI
jgi:hypothetical protein